MTTAQRTETGSRDETTMNSERMTTPRLGVVRESMLMDPLLMKAPLGKARSRGYTVPGPDFTFGCSNLNRDGGVAEALSNWPLQPRREESVQGPDFVCLNRDAVQSGLVTAKELRQYLLQMGRVRVQHQTTKQPQDRTAQRPSAVPDITFGIKNRPSSPLNDLLAHQYGQRWIEEQLSRNHSGLNKTKLGRPAETRTSLMRRCRTLPVQYVPFTLPQFTQIPAALDTFGDPAARQRALGARQQNQGSGEEQNRICCDSCQ
ncbi:cilia- and flagella-associated protein 77 [Anableps anableps]